MASLRGTVFEAAMNAGIHQRVIADVHARMVKENERMATECVSEQIPADADVTIKILRKPGGRRLRIVVEHDTDLVESVSVTANHVDHAPPQTV